MMRWARPGPGKTCNLGQPDVAEAGQHCGNPGIVFVGWQLQMSYIHSSDADGTAWGSAHMGSQATR